MFENLGRMVDAATSLLQARAALIICDLRQAAATLIATAGGAVIAAVGASLLVAALSIVLAERIGWAGSLGVLGGALVVAGVVIIMAFRSHGRSIDSARAAAEREAERSKQMLQSAGDPAPKAGPASRPFDAAGAASGVVQSLLHDRGLLASGLFAAVAVLGARRSVRIISTLASGVGIAASIAKTMKSVNDVRAAASTNGRTAGWPPSPVGTHEGNGYDRGVHG